MLIAQITDLHIGFDGPDGPCKNSERLQTVLAELAALRLKPELILVTGDLVENGEGWAYQNMREQFAQIEVPIYFAVGNHDDRHTFSTVYPDAEFNDGFLQYVIEDDRLRIIVLDTMTPGRHGGAFCEKRAKWLDDRLSEKPGHPTLIAMHHPPIKTGIAWMTLHGDAGWAHRLDRVISAHDNVVHIISGHVHRNIYKKFAGTTLSVSRAVAPQVKLELAEIDIDRPDNRVLLIDADAGYCLHYWDGETLTTHNGLAPEGQPIIHYDEAHAFIVKETLDVGEDEH